MACAETTASRRGTRDPNSLNRTSMRNQKNRTNMMATLLHKFRRSEAALPARPACKHVLLAAVGGFIAIAAIAWLAGQAHAILMLGSFGASCVLVFGFPDAPFSQPRNVIVGHVMCSLVGLVCVTTLGAHWWSLALAVAIVIALMMITRTVHPPAGSNPVIVFLTLPGWDFVIFPTLIGAAMLVLVALLYNSVIRKNGYPKYW
jgi:CBS-domain-containing membrane protein